ncbi:hypothetical protein ABN217_19290, partial [Proteus sp. fly-1067]
MKRNKLRQARSKVAAASVIALLSLGLLSCQQGVERTQKSSTRMLAEADVQGQLINNAEPNLSRLDNKLKQGNQQIHIVQIGDSHTAADFFSGELRTLFQQRYGDAGPGFVPTISIPGQRTATINRKSDKQQWELFSSRKDERFDYPLGGLVALPMKPTSRVQLVPLQAAAGTYQLQALYQ